MEYIILAVALLIMAPAALLPFVSSAQETMEADVRKQAMAGPPRVHPVVTASGPAGLEHRQAA